MVSNTNAPDERARQFGVRIVVLALIPGICPEVVGQTNHTITSYNFTSGTGSATSATHTIRATLGEPLVSNVESVVHSISGGFWVSATPSVCRGGVQRTDLAEFTRCFQGPSADPGQGCHCFDFDGTTKVDLRDFVHFLAALEVNLCEQAGQIGSCCGHDWWSIAFIRCRVMIPDGYQEKILVYDHCRQLVGAVSHQAIGEALSKAGVFVERSGGPAGLRDVARLPGGGAVALLAGPGSDTLLQIDDDLAVRVLAHEFGEAMNRGDEIGNFPRVAVGGSPPAILVTVNSPESGIAVLGLDGQLIHTLPLDQSYHGIAVEPGSNRIFMLTADGELQQYADLFDASHTAVVVGRLPEGIAGRDLSFNTNWRAAGPQLVAVGSDGVAYAVDVQSGSVEVMQGTGLTGVWAIDIDGVRAALARDETAWIDGTSGLCP